MEINIVKDIKNSQENFSEKKQKDLLKKIDTINQQQNNPLKTNEFKVLKLKIQIADANNVLKNMKNKIEKYKKV